MTRKEFILEQMATVRSRSKALIGEVPQNLWLETPPVIESNIDWQVGHLIVSQYYNMVVVVTGRNPRFADIIPLKQYLINYALGSKPTTTNEGKPSPEEHLRYLDATDEFCRAEFQNLPEEDLDNPLEPAKHEHPVAKTKYEAGNWCFQHEMWHCGQISLIKRTINNPTNWFNINQ